MPVVVFCRASTDTVKAVPMDSVFWLVMSCKSIARRRSAIMGMQIRPRPRRAMKLMLSGVTISAAIIRSPSFSRFSSSSMITNLPLRTSSMASGTLQNGIQKGGSSFHT
ncbi:Uncharacterised protein [uncultured archaeon]|nr:Uncharacterised protein [uncultured archaeon]